jgi:hypothetical protein
MLEGVALPDGFRAPEAAELTLVGERDLNPLLQVRDMAHVAARLAQLRRRSFLPRLLGLGPRVEAEIGSLLLETLLTEGWMRYRLLVARAKPGRLRPTSA